MDRKEYSSGNEDAPNAFGSRYDTKRRGYHTPSANFSAGWNDHSKEIRRSWRLSKSSYCHRTGAENDEGANIGCLKIL